MSNFGDHPAGFFGSSSNFYDFEIQNSLLFEGTGGLRINSGEANTSYWTFSVWIKRHKLGGNYNTIMSAMNYGGTYSIDVIGFGSANTMLSIRGSNANAFTSNFGTAVVRDQSAWYHYCLRNNNGTVTRWLNGVEDSTYSISGTGTRIGRSGNHDIGMYGGSSEDYNNNFSLAEFYFINDSGFNNDNNYDYTQFAEFKNGVLVPKENTLTAAQIGDGGWYYEFKQTGDNADASGVGADSSGNNHHASIVGTIAADCRARPDTPTNNFCTLNPLDNDNITLSGGNLSGISTANAHNACGTTFGVTGGKWYWEIRSGGTGSNYFFGMGKTTFSFISQYTNDAHNFADLWCVATDGPKANGGGEVSYGSALSSGDILQLAFDLDNGKFYAGKNGTYFASGDPAAGSNAAFTNVPTDEHMMPFYGNSTGPLAHIFNFGQDSSFSGTETAQGNTDGNGVGDFYYAPPSGFLALCSANLPEPTIGPNSATQADNYFDVTLYTGNGGDKTISGFNFQPDWVWSKSRSLAHNSHSHDSSRGVEQRLAITNAEQEASDGALKTFTSDGYTFDTAGAANTNNGTYVNWVWHANAGTTSSNSDGSATTTVQANTTAGFSIVLYTGTGSATTFGHGLGAVPKWIITKTRSTSGDWMVYHGENTSAPETDFLKLNENNATEDLNTVFNDTAPTSSVFTLGTNGDVNTSGRTQVAYVFAEVEGYSKFGSYTGNGNADGAFVFTGFRPAWVMVKRTDSANNWVINDTTRSPFNEITGNSSTLYADTTNKESDLSTDVDFLSNGFKAYTTGGHRNATGTYIYMAFAEAPFKYANAR